MPLDDDQKSSIARSFEHRMNSAGLHAAQALVELRWGDGAKAKGTLSVRAAKVRKAKRRARVEAEVQYDLERSETDGGGPAQGHDRAIFSVSVDDIDAEQPQVSSTAMLDAKDWQPDDGDDY